MILPIIRSSERRSLKRCPQQWWWAWREGLVPNHQPFGPFWFGTGVHLALAEFYCGPGLKRGPELAETWAKYVGDTIAYIKTEQPSKMDDETETQYEDAKILGLAMLEGYRRLYGNDERKLIISTEQTFAVPIPWPDQEFYEAKPGTPMAIHAGTYDGVWRDAEDGSIWLDEHKTAKQITLNHLPLDDQAGTYWATATDTLRKKRLIKGKESIAGIQYNFLRKALPDDRPRDAQGYATNRPVRDDYIVAIKDLGVHEIAGGKGSVAVEKAKLSELELAARFASLTVLGTRSKMQPAPLFVRHNVNRTSKERATMAAHLQHEALLMQVYRDGYLPITKTPTKDCSWDCRFADMCELKEKGGDWQDLKRFSFSTQDPYADHRKSADD